LLPRLRERFRRAQLCRSSRFIKRRRRAGYYRSRADGARNRTGVRMLVAGLAPEEIVVVGECTAQWARFAPIVEAEVKNGMLFGKPPRICPAEGNMARLRGTVALVLQKHFGASARLEIGQPALLARKKAVG